MTGAPSPRGRGTLTITLFVPGQLRSRLNGSGSRAHWRVIAQETHRWRDKTIAAFALAGYPTWKGPATVTFTAHVGRLWDDDNLPAAIKVIRDTAVALVLGTDDGPTSGHTFQYRQELRPQGERGVLVQITPKEVRDAR